MREIDCDYDDIGYEAGHVIDPSGEIQSYSHRDMEVIGKFDQILRTKHQVEDNIAEGKKDWLYTQNGEHKVGVFPLSPTLVQTLSTIAFNLYRFYGQEEHMKEAFDMLQHGQQVERETARAYEIQELRNLWEAP